MEYTQRQLFTAFLEADRNSGAFKSLAEKDYHNLLISKLPVEKRENATINMDHLRNCLRLYKKKKGERGASCLDQVAAKGSNDIVLNIYYNNTDEIPLKDDMEYDNVDILIHALDETVAFEEKPPSSEPPTKRISRGSELFSTSFTKSYKSFHDMGVKQKRNVTKPLISMLEKFIDTNNFDLSINQLLGYLLLRENGKWNNTCAKIGNNIYLQKQEEPAVFTPMEAVSLMHSLVLSKEQTRKMKDFLATKNVEFPTTNALLPVRKSLRPDTFAVLNDKGRSLEYKDLVYDTISSVLKVVSEKSDMKEGSLKMYLKDGGDGAGTMPVLKSKETVDDEDHIFQYGIIPLKLTVTDASGKENLLWSNPVPNAARSLRPVYLVREVETDSELLKEVISKTDSARKDLRRDGVVVYDTHVSVDIKDSMKDLKFKKLISGLGGAACILCKSKVEDWTDPEKIVIGFSIDRTAADTMEIFNSVVDQDGNIVIKPGDFCTRSGVTKKAISDSDQHSITVTHSYINGCTWYMKMLYRCYADQQVWDEKKTVYGEPIRKAKDPVRESIKKETGLSLDYVNSAGGKGGTSTTGEQARRFFSEQLRQVIQDLLSKRHNIKHQVNMIKLHEQLSIVLRVISCTRKIDIQKFRKHCEETVLNISQNFKWAKLNHTLHGALQHSCELILMNGGESLGWYSEEGLEANNKDIRKYLERLSRKSCRNKQIEDVHHRLLERSDPYLIFLTSKYMAKKSCRECGATDHTIRSHYKCTSESQDIVITQYFV